jgi:hypothetical protein
MKVQYLKSGPPKMEPGLAMTSFINISAKPALKERFAEAARRRGMKQAELGRVAIERLLDELEGHNA